MNSSARSFWWCAAGLFSAILLPLTLVRAQESTAPDDSSAAAESYPAPSSQTGGSGVQGLDRFRGALLPGSFEEDQNGIPYSSVIAPTGADIHSLSFLTTTPIRTGDVVPAKLGNAEGSVELQTASPNISLPPFFRSAPEPQDANIKAGPLFIKFHYLDGLVIYDDNYQLRETDRKSELLVLLGLNLTAIAQLGDNLQFAISGSIYYLPIQNQVGIGTSALSNLGLLISAAPLFAAQLVNTANIAGWPVTFADDFRVTKGNYSNGTRDNFDLFQGDYLVRDQNGRYYFRSNNSSPNNGNQYSNSSPNSTVLVFSNDVSAVTTRLLPTDTRLTVSISHENLWYQQSSGSLPSGDDEFNASLVSERYDLRFKPFVSYEAYYTEGLPSLTQSIQAGIFGPIDDQLFLVADAGYYINANEHNGALFRLSLDHTAGPYTTETLSVDRNLTAFNQEEITSEYYKLHQIIGPTLDGSLFLVHSTSRELVNDSSSNYTDEIGGLRLGWLMGPKTSLEIEGLFEHQTYTSGVKSDTVTGRLILNRTLTDTLLLQLFYQYQRVSENSPGSSYYENLVYIRLTKSLE